MVFCIGCGKFNRKYFFILLAVLSKLISQLGIGLKYSVFDGINIFNINLVPITYFTTSFFFSSIIGIIGLYLNHKSLKKNENTSKKITNKNEIFYIVTVYNPGNLCEKIRIQLILGIIFVFTETFDQLFYSEGLGGLDYWMFDIIYIYIFMSKYMKMRILPHQKYSLYLCLISSFIFKFISNFLDSHTLENGKEDNVCNYVYKKYKDQWISIPIIMISFIIMLIIRAYGNTKLKYSMDILFLSPYRVLMVYGIFGLIFCIIYIISSIFIKLKPLGTIDEFLENIKNIFALSCSIIYGIFNSFKILFDILIIKNLSPFHMLVKYKIYYLLIQFILFCYNRELNFMIFYLVELSSDIICFIGFLIFLELIEIRCKGLNYELRENIIKRSENDFMESLYDERICKF
jgi:hypothetical protein